LETQKDIYIEVLPVDDPLFIEFNDRNYSQLIYARELLPLNFFTLISVDSPRRIYSLNISCETCEWIVKDPNNYVKGVSFRRINVTILNLLGPVAKISDFLSNVHYVCSQSRGSEDKITIVANLQQGSTFTGVNVSLSLSSLSSEGIGIGNEGSIFNHIPVRVLPKNSDYALKATKSLHFINSSLISISDALEFVYDEMFNTMKCELDLYWKYEEELFFRLKYNISSEFMIISNENRTSISLAVNCGNVSNIFSAIAIEAYSNFSNKFSSPILKNSLDVKVKVPMIEKKSDEPQVKEYQLP